MPIYEYICRKCNHRFEIFHRREEHLKSKCPQCQSGEVEKLFSVFGFCCGSTFVSSSSREENCKNCATKSCGTCGR